MSIERLLRSLRREFLLDLSTGFVYDVLRDRASPLDMAEHRRRVLDQFSGRLCVDEIHPGRFAPLPATDPIRDLPAAFAPVGANDRDHMRRSVGHLKTWGLAPRVVITDGSNLYPAVLAELWPDAEHQLCVFHMVRTNNHVERTNRMVRFLEKVRSEWRRRRTLVRLLVPRLAHIWSRAAAGSGRTGSRRARPRRGKPHAHGQQARRVA